MNGRDGNKSPRLKNVLLSSLGCVEKRTSSGTRGMVTVQSSVVGLLGSKTGPMVQSSFFT